MSATTSPTEPPPSLHAGLDAARVIFLNEVACYLRSPDISSARKRHEIAVTVSAVAQLGMVAYAGAGR